MPPGADGWIGTASADLAALTMSRLILPWEANRGRKKMFNDKERNGGAVIHAADESGMALTIWLVPVRALGEAGAGCQRRSGDAIACDPIH